MVVGGEVHAPVVVGHAVLHRAAGRVRPVEVTGARLERVHLPAPVADEDAVPDDERRGLARPDLSPPDDLPALGGEGDDEAVKARSGGVARRFVEERLEDELSGDCRR